MLSYTEHLNTPRLVADSAGAAVWRWDQVEPFGVNVPDENPSSLGAFEFPLRFPGQYADKETNLHHNAARDYWAEGGRYVQFDPIGMRGGINGFIYAYDSPLRYTDPTGLSVWLCVRKLSGAVPGNHIYLWDDTRDRCCGRVPGTDPLKDCKEAGPGSDFCTLIPGSQG